MLFLLARTTNLVVKSDFGEDVEEVEIESADFVESAEFVIVSFVVNLVSDSFVINLIAECIEFKLVIEFVVVGFVIDLIASSFVVDSKAECVELVVNVDIDMMKLRDVYILALRIAYEVIKVVSDELIEFFK